jgi:catechol 2,3-dioxygenase-like lactoylglutathione lyase family enzyme
VRVQGLVFAGIETPDPPALAGFLADVLGVEAGEEGGVFTLQLPGGDAVAVVEPGHLAPPSDTVLGFLVGDLDAAVAELESRGVPKKGPLLMSTVFRWQHFRAPDGRIFELVERQRG